GDVTDEGSFSAITQHYPVYGNARRPGSFDEVTTIQGRRLQERSSNASASTTSAAEQGLSTIVFSGQLSRKARVSVLARTVYSRKGTPRRFKSLATGATTYR